MSTIISSTTLVYDGWTRLRLVRLRRADGQEFTREVEDHGASAAVLPYDPVRRVALMVRQLRVPVLLDAGQDSLLEVPAGMTDGGDPADTARRELHEEVGLRVSTLEPVASAFSSPGLSTEHIDLYLARYSAADRVAAGGGLATEHEDITVEEIALATLWSMAEARTLNDLKSLTLLFALRLRHPELFA